MKNKYKFLGLLGLLPFLATAQLTNNGATIVIESGATLVVEGSITNMATSTITNSGTIEVQGDFTNDGTLTSTATNADIVFNGTVAQAFDANGASVRKVTVNKATENVTLASPLTITNELTLTDGLLDIAAQDLTLGSAATAAGSAASYVKADGAGMVVKTYGATGNFTFPVGDATAYSPLDANVTAGTVGASTLGVNVSNAAHPSLPVDANNPNRNATEYITRSWDIDQAGFGVGFSADVTGTYDDTDDVVQVAGENLIKAAMWDGTEWSYDETDNTPTDQVAATITDSRELTGMNTFGKSMVQVILGGAYDDATNLMRTDLNGGSAGILATEALTSPYGTGESVASTFFAANLDIVDWIKIELRSSADNENIIASRSAFVESDGTIVDIDGSSGDEVLFFKDAPADSYIAIRHRNHLGILLNTTTSFLSTPGTVDFSNTATVTFGTDSQQTFDGKFMMYSADVSGDGYIRAKEGSVGFPPVVIPSDRTTVLNTGLGGNVNGQLTNAYSVFDANLDGYVRAKEGSVGFPPVVIPSDRTFILNFPLQGLVNSQKEEQLPEN